MLEQTRGMPDSLRYPLKLSLINNEMEKWKFTISKKWGENVQTFISNAFKFLGL